MFTQEQLRKLRAMGSAGLTTKLAQHDGYTVTESDSPEKQLVSVFGQKYFTKKASMKNISKGIAAMHKLSGVTKTASSIDYSWDVAPKDLYAAESEGGLLPLLSTGELQYNYNAPDTSRETLQEFSQLAKDIKRKKDIDPWFRAEQGLAKNIGITGLLTGGLYGANALSQYLDGPDLRVLKSLAPLVAGIGGVGSLGSYIGDKVNASMFNESKGYKAVADQLRDVPKEVRSLKKKNRNLIEARDIDPDNASIEGVMDIDYLKNLRGDKQIYANNKDILHAKQLAFENKREKKAFIFTPTTVTDTELDGDDMRVNTKFNLGSMNQQEIRDLGKDMLATGDIDPHYSSEKNLLANLALSALIYGGGSALANHFDSDTGANIAQALGIGSGVLSGARYGLQKLDNSMINGSPMVEFTGEALSKTKLKPEEE